MKSDSLARNTRRLIEILWASTALLIGLRHPREEVRELIEGVATMVLGIRGIEDSWVYQDILDQMLDVSSWHELLSSVDP
jgi:hypothetical protein